MKNFSSFSFLAAASRVSFSPAPLSTPVTRTSSLELAVTLRAAILLAALHLDDQNLLAPALADDFAVHVRAREGAACPE